MTEAFTTWEFLLDQPKVIAEIFPRIGEARFQAPSLRIIAEEEGVSLLLIPDRGSGGRTETISWISVARTLLRSDSFSFEEMKTADALFTLRRLGLSYE